MCSRSPMSLSVSVCLCACARPDVSIDNSLLRSGRRPASLKEALNKQRIETEG